MNVTASKKPSFGGWIGASCPPASDVTLGGWKFGFVWFAHAAVGSPASWPRMMLGNRPLAMNGVTVAFMFDRLFHETPAPICVGPLVTCAMVEGSASVKPWRR